MNLIEQLGGYEKAKAFLNATSFTIDELIMMQRSGLRTQHVEKALLEYRRQHNIFEVGDKVVFVSEKMDFLDDDQIHSISVITENNLPKVCGLYVSFEVIKHATDEEIKAGKRLEVK